MRPEVPAEVSDLVTRLMDPDPEMRFPSARTVSAALTGFTLWLPHGTTPSASSSSVARPGQGRVLLLESGQRFIQGEQVVSESRGEDVCLPRRRLEAGIGLEMQRGLLRRGFDDSPDKAFEQKAEEKVNLLQRVRFCVDLLLLRALVAKEFLDAGLLL